MPRITSITNQSLAGIAIRRRFRQIPIGSPTDFNGLNTSDFYVEYDPFTTNRIVAVYALGSVSCAVRVGIYNADNSLTWGTEVTVSTGQFCEDPIVCFDRNVPGRFVIVWSNSIGSGGALNSRLATITSGTVVTLQPLVVVDSGVCFDPQMSWPLLNAPLLTYRKNNLISSRVPTISGSTLSWGSEVVMDPLNTITGPQRLDSQNDQLILFYFSGGQARYAICTTQSGTPSWFTFHQSTGISEITSIRALRAVPTPNGGTNLGRFVLAYRTSSSEFFVNATVQGGNSIVFNTPVSTGALGGGNPVASLRIANPGNYGNKFYAVYMSTIAFGQIAIVTLRLDQDGLIEAVDAPIGLSGGSLNSATNGISINSGQGRLVAWYNDNIGDAQSAYRMRQIFGQA